MSYYMEAVGLLETALGVKGLNQAGNFSTDEERMIAKTACRVLGRG
jgi:hypothetical protein